LSQGWLHNKKKAAGDLNKGHKKNTGVTNEENGCLTRVCAADNSQSVEGAATGKQPRSLPGAERIEWARRFIHGKVGLEANGKK